ncbi:dipicolinate synthase subunit A [Virgibacillus pantothenticus]|uniref:dipicolinate synthase subunit DpsA n=1 Tax=Virgibacillus pantothenticus TaxID=1473 RepID=UPI001B22ACA1|nr:dipicolinate synthase subunit DpsA [Virgibacillus pantothenticus]GIP62298.1 dipicolinate synthase subunit A [Virgibacillus pantothenticus]
MNMRHVLIMGGDARYLHVIESLSRTDNQLYLIGFHHLSFKKHNVKHTELEHTNLSMMDAIILPVAGTDEKGKVEITYADESLFLTEQILSCTPKHCTIYTGTANDYLREICLAANRKMVRLFDRDDVAIYNSIPTAEGALKLAIEATEETIHSSNVCVLGFGRVGKTVARLFHAVGAHVHVAARNSADLARITEMGLTAIKTDQLNTVIGNIAICINTIPKLVIDENLIGNMSPSAVVIDLASKPGGVDTACAKQHHIKAIHALGLPGKTAPKTAGKILAKVLIDSFNNE